MLGKSQIDMLYETQNQALISQKVVSVKLIVSNEVTT